MARLRKTAEQNAFDVALGARIERLRKERGMKSKALARMIGTSYQQIYFYETGTYAVPSHLLPRLAAALGVEVSALVQTYSFDCMSERERAESPNRV